MTDAENKKIKKILMQKNAPQGEISSDFKVALYVVACLYQVEIKSKQTIGICSHLLGNVGFKGHIASYTLDDYKNTLQELVSSGALVELGDFNIYASPDQISSLKGEVRAEEVISYMDGEKSFIYVINDEKGNKYNLKSRIVLMPHDEVEAFYVKDATYAYVSRLVLKRQCLLGRIQLIGHPERYALINPDEPNLSQQVFEVKTKEDLNGAKSGDVVIAEIVKRSPSKFIVKVRETVHDIGDLNSVIVMAVLRNDIPNTWPSSVTNVLSRIPTEVSPKDRIGREDIRDIPLVTIDGEDARDFDDAVYCKKEGDNWRLYVAIADVSYYVRPGTNIDKEAMYRCNSCYFPNYVIPMLPEKLSNGICSLNPEVDRLCMCCEMVIDKRGKTSSYRFYPAVMRSHARLTYTEVWQMISHGNTEIKEHSSLIPAIKDLYDLYKAFERYRKERGGISIESQELHFIFNEHMEIAGVAPLERNDAHKLIEECMIAANVAAASFVASKKLSTLYRIHAKPSEKKLGLLISQLARFGIDVAWGDEPSSKDYAALSTLLEKREDGKVLGEMLLRSMSKAEYNQDNIGHFGLALEKYAHFTSPIRRYADLQLHRVIKFILEKENKEHPWGKIGARSYNKSELATLGERCTAREIAADTAEQEVDATLACIYAQKFIGETLEGTITGCTSFGLFVHLDSLGADGMIFIGNFNDYMTYDQKRQVLLSSNNKAYSIGMKIPVTIASVDVDERKIDLIPATSLKKKPDPKLIKQRDKILNKIEQQRSKNKATDKEEIFKNIADITRAKEALAEDEVLKVQASDDKDEWLGDLDGIKHYENPFKMPNLATETVKAHSFYANNGKKKKNKNRNKR